MTVPCPSSAAIARTEMHRRIVPGDHIFCCRASRRTCNERPGTPFNHLQVPVDSAALVVPGCLEYKLSPRTVA